MAAPPRAGALLRRGLDLAYLALGWNAVGGVTDERGAADGAGG